MSTDGKRGVRYRGDYMIIISYNIPKNENRKAWNEKKSEKPQCQWITNSNDRLFTCCKSHIENIIKRLFNKQGSFSYFKVKKLSTNV